MIKQSWPEKIPLNGRLPNSSNICMVSEWWAINSIK